MLPSKVVFISFFAFNSPAFDLIVDPFRVFLSTLLYVTRAVAIQTKNNRIYITIQTGPQRLGLKKYIKPVLNCSATVVCFIIFLAVLRFVLSDLIVVLSITSASSFPYVASYIAFEKIALIIFNI